ncbi:MAG TPA: succinylglutamate desuccinylase/aspartoacylase family protein [Verrucomicrobiota bacterium]|nr:succinylglutamate desuccinylase/aspartoacylase family protein [Verrucomicrobiota bacterium]
MSIASLKSRYTPSPVRPQRRQIERLLAPLNQIAERSPDFIMRPLAEFESEGQRYTLPRYIYLGQRGGGDVIRIGIFATIHGDEPEGALALGRLFAELDRNPEIGTGYALYVYPVCNPTGFEDNTRHSRRGKDLNREFWKQSSEPEVRLLESEICMHAFDGIVTLHSDDTSDGLYAFVSGAVLTENLTEPALRSAERFLPRNRRRVIDGFHARQGIVSDCYNGVLKSVPGVARPPFEITFETPQDSPLHLQVDATAEALQTILVEYRHLMAIAQNI